MLTLNNRLKAAYELCREGKIAADVGCDHAQLACCLAMNKSKSVIASDVREGPLEAAYRTVDQCGVENVSLVLSDGLEKVGYADDVIICGMGGELIARIIDGCRFLSRDTRFILQPMTRADYLRRWLYEKGFDIREERTAVDGGRYYSVMCVEYTGDRKEIDEVFALTGKITNTEHLTRIAAKLIKNADGMGKSEGFAEQEQALRKTAEKILQKAEELK